MSLVSKKADVPSISSSSDKSIHHIDNGSISIADQIGFKRINWGRLPPKSSRHDSSQSGCSRSRSRSSHARSSSRSTHHLVILFTCESVVKMDDTIVVWKESLVRKLILDDILGQEVDTIVGFEHWDEVMQGKRSNIDASLMDKVGQFHARSMKLLKLDFDLKNQFFSSLLSDNVRNKSHIFPCS